MGCIVNGPGEMADADFGYKAGGAPGKINLYVGKNAVRLNIPEGEYVARLVDLVREHGRWTEPPSRGVGTAKILATKTPPGRTHSAADRFSSGPTELNCPAGAGN